MKQLLRNLANWMGLFFLTLTVLNVNGQLKDYVLFGKTGVQVGTSAKVLNGKVGSNLLVTSTGTASLNGACDTLTPL